MNSMIINQNTLHFEICLLAVLLALELDKGILKAIASAFVANDFAGYDSAKTAEYQI